MRYAILLMGILWSAGVVVAQEEPPTEWIEPKTGHRVVRLSKEPGTASLYFHQNAYTADGQKLIVTTRKGLSAIDLATREISPLVEGRVGVLVTGRKSGDIYYSRDGIVYATNVASREERRVAELPRSAGRGNVTVNADETLVVGLGRDPDGEAEPRTPPDGHREDRLARRWSQGLPMMLYTIDVASGEMK